MRVGIEMALTQAGSWDGTDMGTLDEKASVVLDYQCSQPLLQAKCNRESEYKILFEEKSPQVQ